MSGALGTGCGPDQLPLGVTLPSRRSFANFVAGPNDAAVAGLRALLGARTGGAAYLWGGGGCGKTHLLEACCAEPSYAGQPVAYVALGRPRTLPEVLEGLGDAALLCIDDVDAVAGDRAWEEALFHLYNGAEQAGCPMVFAARAAPRTPPWCLPDLVSRLTAATVWRLRPLGDEGCRAALALHARERGFSLSDEVTTFLVRRLRRDMGTLSAFLERMDRSSLAAQRRITVPFVKALLREADGERV